MKNAGKIVCALFSLLLAATPALAAGMPPPLAAAPDAVIPNAGFSKLAERLLPAVVNISTTQTLKNNMDGPLDVPGMPGLPPGFEDFFKDFMERSTPGGKNALPYRERKTTSLGSGFIIDPSGYIVTNNHVIQDADEINVILHDDTSLKAKVVGRDPKTDISLLKVEYSRPLPYLTFGDSDVMKVGDWILVIGNPFGLGGTVTQGIISARARNINSGPYDDYIQTDAPINRGNSGGPMFNMKGEIIGIATAIFSPSGGSVGIGFAIPSSMAKNVVDQLRETGKIRRGWLGVRIQNVTDDIAQSLNMPKTEGALVSSLTPGSPAGKAGMAAGDVIVRFDGKEVTEMRTLPRMVAETPIRKSVSVIVWRDGGKVGLKVRIGEMKDPGESGSAEGGPGKGESGPSVTSAVSVPELDLKVSAISAITRQTYQLSDEARGLVITGLGDASPLLDKGARPGDVIVEAGQKAVKAPRDLQKLAKDAASSKKPLLLLIDRQGDLRFVAVGTVEAKGKKK